MYPIWRGHNKSGNQNPTVGIDGLELAIIQPSARSCSQFNRLPLQPGRGLCNCQCQHQGAFALQPFRQRKTLFESLRRILVPLDQTGPYDLDPTGLLPDNTGADRSKCSTTPEPCNRQTNQRRAIRSRAVMDMDAVRFKIGTQVVRPIGRLQSVGIVTRDILIGNKVLADPGPPIPVRVRRNAPGCAIQRPNE